MAMTHAGFRMDASTRIGEPVPWIGRVESTDWSQITAESRMHEQPLLTHATDPHGSHDAGAGDHDEPFGGFRP